MTRLPPKRQRPRMGVQKPPQREFPRHRKFVRSHGCCVPDCDHPRSPIEFAHVKTRGAGGHDCFGISLCRSHHMEQHKIGVDSFGKKYGIDLWALAREFTRRSPDLRMKDSLKLVELEHA